VADESEMAEDTIGGVNLYSIPRKIESMFRPPMSDCQKYNSREIINQDYDATEESFFVKLDEGEEGEEEGKSEENDAYEGGSQDGSQGERDDSDEELYDDKKIENWKMEVTTINILLVGEIDESIVDTDIHSNTKEGMFYYFNDIKDMLI